MGIFDKAKEAVSKAVGNVREKVNETVSTLSGKAVEDEVRLYSETYGEVLLGMHRELTQAHVRVQTMQDSLDRTQKEVQKLYEENARLNQTVISLNGICSKLEARVTSQENLLEVRQKELAGLVSLADLLEARTVSGQSRSTWAILVAILAVVIAALSWLNWL